MNWTDFHFTLQDQRQEIDFLLRLQSFLQHVLLYEDENLQRQTRNIIPLAELKEKAKESSEKTKQAGDSGVDERDCLILVLLDWFKGKYNTAQK